MDCQKYLLNFVFTVNMLNFTFNLFKAASVGFGWRGGPGLQGSLNCCACATQTRFAHAPTKPRLLSVGSRIQNRGCAKRTVSSCWAGSQGVTDCASQWEARIGDCYRMCRPTGWRGGEPTEGTVLQHHCLSLVTKGGGQNAEKGCFLVKPLFVKIGFYRKLSQSLWQSVTLTEDSCHRGMPLLTSSG